MSDQALLIIDHGSRAQLATDEFTKLIDMVRSENKYACVLGAHMEIKEPSIETAVSEIFNKGFKKVIVVPYFLFSGNHSKIDIPDLIEKTKEKYPGIHYEFTQPIAVDPSMVSLILKKANLFT